MTECISNSYSSFPYKPNRHFRRPSITKGTISSIAKDVRSNDTVASLIRKRNNMPPSSVQHQRRLSARPSSIDLRSSRVATDGKQQSVSNFNPTLSSVKLRLDEKNNNNKHSATAVIKQREEDLCLMRRCEACNRRNDSQCNHNNMMTERQENKGMGGLVSGYASSSSLSSISSSSSSSSSSTSSSCKTRRRRYSETNTSPLWPFAQPPPPSSKVPIHQLRETIIEDLTSSIVSYSNQIQDLSNAISISFSSTSFETLAFKRVYYREQQSGATYRSQIKECKALIVQQKELLDRLEELVFEEENHHEQQVMLKQPTTSIDQSSRLLRKFKDSLVKPTGLTQLVIRQNKLKKKDTIISIQGICETKESSLIPNKVKRECNMYRETFSPFFFLLKFSY